MYLLFTYFTGCEIFSCDSCRTKKRTGSNTHVKYNYTQLKLIYTMKSKYMSIFNIITQYYNIYLFFNQLSFMIILLFDQLFSDNCHNMYPNIILVHNYYNLFDIRINNAIKITEE